MGCLIHRIAGCFLPRGEENNLFSSGAAFSKRHVCRMYRYSTKKYTVWRCISHCDLQFIHNICSFVLGGYLLSAFSIDYCNMSLLKQIDDKGAVLEWSPISQNPNLVALGTKVLLYNIPMNNQSILTVLLIRIHLELGLMIMVANLNCTV